MKVLLVLLLLAACGRLPMPFERTTGASPASDLTRSPPARIVVPPSTSLGLTEHAARRFAGLLAGALQEQEVPATAAGIARPQYRLLASAEPAGGVVRLTYTLVDADGAVLGAAGGPRAVPAGPWAGGEEGVLRQAAVDGAQAVAALIARVDGAARAAVASGASPRTPTLRFGGVRGAPGDGNVALSRAVRSALAREGLVVQDGPTAEFDLEASVSITELPRRQQRVEIVWTVRRADGTELGTVTQLNELPRGALDGLWADVAVVVADQAAGGVAEVIRRARAGG